MRIDGIIKELKKRTKCDEILADDDINLVDYYQMKLYDGFICIIIKENILKKSFEVYASIKSRTDIATPLLYKKFIDKNNAINYFLSLKNFLENNPEKNITNRCKMED